MPVIFLNIFRALGVLLIIIVVSGVYDAIMNAACDSSKGGKLFSTLWKGFVYCGLIAVSLAIYAQGDYEITDEERLGKFAFYMTLFYIPVVLGAYKGKDNKP